MSIGGADLGGRLLLDERARPTGASAGPAARRSTGAEGAPPERRASGAAEAPEAPAAAPPEAPRRVAAPNGAELAEFPLRKLSFRVDSETHEVVISVVDEKSGEVVRQIPPEEALRLAKALERVRGLLVDAEG